jgi:hypothetical protein
MSRSPDLDSRIDDLYRGPLDEFISARKALASELTGDERRRVQALKKPTTVPWAANQVYWHARQEFDRLIKSGEALRKAQVAALKGRSADVRQAVSDHRDAVADAVAKAVALGASESSRDALTQTFEALSLGSSPDPPGRLTQPLRPGGFEMLAGVQPAQIATKVREAARPSGPAKPHEVRLKPDTTGNLDRDARQKPSRSTDPAKLQPSESEPRSARSARLQPSDSERRREAALAAKRAERERIELERAVRAREREQQAEKKRRDGAIQKAEATLERAREKAADAERAWREAQQQVEDAARALRNLK